MSLLVPMRRLLGLAILAVLVLPLLMAPFTAQETISVEENRALAAPPGLPTSLTAALALPRKTDAYIADHFAFRDVLIAASAKLGRLSGGLVGAGPGNRVLAVTGPDGQMFLLEGLLQSTGKARNERRAQRYADWACGLNQRLGARGVRVLASLAPSPGEIIPEAAPPFALPAQRPTDYDSVLAGLRACGVPAVDLRPPLIAAKSRGAVYKKTDTHWTQLGALTAYNVLMEAMGRPDWAIADNLATWTEGHESGDLARMLGQQAADESQPVLVLSPPTTPTTRRALEGLKLSSGGQALPPYIIETGRVGPRVLVVGDSYTTGEFFTPWLARSAGATAWIHMDLCHFDERVFDLVKPDFVLLIPAERMALCR